MNGLFRVAKGKKKVPMSVKDLLKEIKDTSELMIDLAYSSILFDEIYFGQEVIELEQKMEDILFELRKEVMLAARKISEVGPLSNLLKISIAAEKITDAAADIAEIKVMGIGIPRSFLRSIHLIEETITSAEIKDSSAAVGLTVEKLEEKTNMNIVAVKKAKGWIVNPPSDTKIEVNDKVIAKGPFEALPTFDITVTGEHFSFPSLSEIHEPQELRRIREMVLDMKNLSELSLDLAYSSVLFNNKEIAYHVSQIEQQLDDLRASLEKMVLQYAKKSEDVDQLRGLLHLADASERISDASKEIADIISSGKDLHPILLTAIMESDETIIMVKVKPNSQIAGKTMAEAMMEIKAGMDAIAMRKYSDQRWYYNPKGDITIEAGDVIIAKGKKGNEDVLIKLAETASQGDR